MQSLNNGYVVDLRIRNSLVRYNGMAALFHFIAVITIIIVVAIFDMPMNLHLQKIYFKTTNENIPPYLKSRYCPFNGTSVEYFDGFSFLKCVRNNGFDPNIPRVLVSEDVDQFVVWPFILSLEIVNTIFHYIVGFYTPITYYYLIFLNYGISPFKYFQLSITQPLIILTLCAINEITDIYTIIYVAVTTSSMNLVCFLGYEVLSSVQKLKTIDYDRKMLINYLKYNMLLFGYFFFILPLVIVHETYHLSIESYFEVDNKKFWYDIYGLVIVVNIGLSILYCVFPILHAVQNAYIFNYYLRKFDYIVFEPFFVINSTLAGGFLAVSLIVQSIQRY
jgi:hypothetical protein